MAKRHIFRAALILSFSMVGAARAAPVVWTFYQTGCTVDPGAAGYCGQPGERGPISTPPTPVGTLTLPSPDSSGSATYSTSTPPPVLTGDGNNFSLAFGFPLESGSGLILNPPTQLSLGVSYYIVDWTETNGDLTDIHVGYDIPDFSANASVGQSGGQVGSDTEIGSCVAGQCILTGYWSSTASVPGPSSLTSLLTGLLLLAPLAMVRRPRRPHPAACYNSN